MFKISLAMIVKDEELSLARILKIAKEFADEIIVVDTGSRDRTKAIAKEYTDKVFDFAWQNDFSLARNYSFSLASHEYIMWLDADDYIEKSDIDKILQLKNSTAHPDVFMFKYCIGDNFEFYRERLVKKSMGFTWQGAVHEVITPRGNIVYTDIKIIHKKIKHTNPKRNLNIYRGLLKNGHTFSPREQYYYSRELFYNGYYKKCIREFIKYLHLKDSYTPNLQGAYIMIADAYIALNNYADAQKTLFNSLSLFVPTAEICCKIAECFDKLNQKHLSIYWYESALLCPKQSDGFINLDYASFIPYIELCRLYYPQNISLSAKYHKLCKDIKPNHPSVKYNDQFFK